MMSLKTIRIWIIGLSAVIGITLAGWIILHFVLQIDSMNEYPLISRFWYGVEDACAFTTILLACVFGMVVIYGIFVAVYTEIHEDDVVVANKKRYQRQPEYNGFYDYRRPKKQKAIKTRTPKNNAVVAKKSSMDEDW